MITPGLVLTSAHLAARVSGQPSTYKDNHTGLPIAECRGAEGPEHPTSDSWQTPTWPQVMPLGIGNTYTPCYVNAFPEKDPLNTCTKDFGSLIFMFLQTF